MTTAKRLPSRTPRGWISLSHRARAPAAPCTSRSPWGCDRSSRRSVFSRALRLSSARTNKGAEARKYYHPSSIASFKHSNRETEMKTHLALAALVLISACKGPNVQEVQQQEAAPV